MAKTKLLHKKEADEINKLKKIDLVIVFMLFVIRHFFIS